MPQPSEARSQVSKSWLPSLGGRGILCPYQSVILAKCGFLYSYVVGWITVMPPCNAAVLANFSVNILSAFTLNSCWLSWLKRACWLVGIGRWLNCCFFFLKKSGWGYPWMCKLDSTQVWFCILDHNLWLQKLMQNQASLPTFGGASNFSKLLIWPKHVMWCYPSIHSALTMYVQLTVHLLNTTVPDLTNALEPLL